MVPMVEWVVMMKIQTSITGSKGFTLVELLIVLLIVSVITSVAMLSINAARPSQAQVLFEQLKNQAKVSKKIAQIKNINFRIIIDDNQSNVERLDPQTHTWKNSKVPTVKWKNINVHSDELEISILPNGYTTSSVISFELDGFNYQFNPSLL